MGQFFDIVKAILSGFLIFVQFCVEGVVSLVSAFSSVFGLGWSEAEIGLVAGVVLAGVVGFIVFRLNIWWKTITRPFKPQAVIHTTAKTPAQVTSQGSLTFLLGMLLFAGLILLFWVIG